jgi:hypothetical protein
MSLPINTSSIVDALRATLADIDKQIAAAKRDAQIEYRPIHEEPPTDWVYRMKYRDGSYVLTPLLVARANCLAAIANLQAAQTRPKR